MAAIAAAVIAGVGTGISAIGQIQAGQAAQQEAESQQAVANFNAQVQRREAEAIRQKTEFEQVQQAKESRRRLGTLRAALGAAGVVTGEGTPLQLQATQVIEDELENLLIGQRGKVAAGRALSQADIDVEQARLFGARGRAARTAGFIGAGATTLRGVGQSILTGFNVGRVRQ